MYVSFFRTANVGVKESMREYYWWVCPGFPCNAAYFVHLTWMVCEMGSKWSYSCFLGGCFCPKQHISFLYCSHLSYSPCFSLKSMWCIHIVTLTQPLLRRTPVWFYLRLNFYMIDNLSNTVYVFLIRMLTSLLLDEMLLLRYVNLSINFRSLPNKGDATLYCFKLMNFVLFAFT